MSLSVKETLEKAVQALDGNSGTKEEIIAMAEAICPELSQNPYKQRSLNQAFSKYLQVTPARVMLLHVGEIEERRAPASAQTFCLKSAVIECL